MSGQSCVFEGMVWFVFVSFILFCHDVSGSSMPIHWYAPFYSGGGYSSEAIAFVSILSNLSFPFSISQHGDSINQNFIQNMRNYEKNLLDSKFTRMSSPGEISICHSEPGAWHAPFPHYQTQQCPSTLSSYKIGRTMFETDRIPSGWVSRLNFMDEIWVPTVFAQEIFIKEGVDKRKVHVVSEPVDTDFYSPQSLENSQERLNKLRSDISEHLIRQETSEINDSTFVYLFVGKWEYRKGVQVLIQAFLNEFNQSFADSSNAEERVDLALVIVTSAYHSTNDFFHALIQDLLNEQTLSPSILLSPQHLPTSLSIKDLDPTHPVTRLLRRIVLLTDVPQVDMPALYQLSNVLVGPSSMNRSDPSIGYSISRGRMGKTSC
jgi:glycosyltransferase involved in cell wall biosynthesis